MSISNTARQYCTQSWFLFTLTNALVQTHPNGNRTEISKATIFYLKVHVSFTDVFKPLSSSLNV